LLDRLAGRNTIASQLAAAQAESGGGRQRARQNRKGAPAEMTDPTANPNEIVAAVVGLSATAAMTDDALAVAQRAEARQEAERDHPGSELSLASGSAINRITAGVKARRDRSRQVSICWPGLHPPGNFDRKKEYSFASAVASPPATLAGLEPLFGNYGRASR
jgi:hypothetical protein